MKGSEQIKIIGERTSPSWMAQLPNEKHVEKILTRLFN